MYWDWDQCILFVTEPVCCFWAWISAFCDSIYETMFQRRAKQICIKLGSKTQIYRNSIRNPIPSEYIKIGSAGYWCTNCLVIDVPLFTFAGGVCSQCGVNGDCVCCVFMCDRERGRQEYKDYPRIQYKIPIWYTQPTVPI